MNPGRGIGSGRTPRRSLLADAPVSAGVAVVGASALLAGGLMLARGGWREEGMRFWTFAVEHRDLYEGIVREWNASGGEPVVLRQVTSAALERRLLASFFADVPGPDLVEVERGMAPLAFAGPLEAIGFLDLTERIQAEGLFDEIDPAAFSPWTSRGRIFGLPHDVHPVMLAYRADLVEGAGIDVSEIETWDDFRRVLAPLMADADGDGEPDRYLLAFWENVEDKVEVFLLQADGRLFDEEERPALDAPANARALAEMATWVAGPGRFATDVPDFSASGNRLKVDGRALFYVMPDWMCDVWQNDLPQLAGKMKLMPLPAFVPGGRRTSVWGGTMLAITDGAPDPEAAWAFAKHLYLSDELAVRLYEEAEIITPIRRHWSHPVFDEPDPFFSGQAKGRLYIGLIPQVPPRNSSPFYRIARRLACEALRSLAAWHRAHPGAGRSELEARAADLLRDAQEELVRRMEANVFHRGALREEEA